MKKLILALMCFFVLGVSVQAQEPTEGDVQVWHETKVYLPSVKVTDEKGNKVKVISPFVMGTLRFGQDVRHFVDERVGAGFDLRLNKYVKVTPSYYYIASQPTKGVKKFENRYRLAVTAEKKWTNFTVSNRNRIEYLAKNSASDTIRYRNKTKVGIPVRNNNEVLFTPFASFEPVYSFTNKKWTRNELTAGVGKKLNDNVSGEIFYVYRRNHDTNVLKNVQGLGVNLKFSID